MFVLILILNFLTNFIFDLIGFKIWERSNLSHIYLRMNYHQSQFFYYKICVFVPNLNNVVKIKFIFLTFCSILLCYKYQQDLSYVIN